MNHETNEITAVHIFFFRDKNTIDFFLIISFLVHLKNLTCNRRKAQLQPTSKKKKNSKHISRYRLNAIMNEISQTSTQLAIAAIKHSETREKK